MEQFILRAAVFFICNYKMNHKVVANLLTRKRTAHCSTDSVNIVISNNFDTKCSFAFTVVFGQ